jgi:hypothetical protein
MQRQGLGPRTMWLIFFTCHPGEWRGNMGADVGLWFIQAFANLRGAAILFQTFECARLCGYDKVPEIKKVKVFRKIHPRCGDGSI